MKHLPKFEKSTMDPQPSFVKLRFGSPIGPYHFGRVEETLKKKQRALDEGYKKHPERWVHGPPKVKRPLKEVWINAPTEAAKELTNTVFALSNN